MKGGRRKGLDYGYAVEAPRKFLGQDSREEQAEETLMEKLTRNQCLQLPVCVRIMWGAAPPAGLREEQSLL